MGFGDRPIRRAGREDCLEHAVSATVRAYRRAVPVEPRRAIVQAWGDFLCDPDNAPTFLASARDMARLRRRQVAREIAPQCTHTSRSAPAQSCWRAGYVGCSPHVSGPRRTSRATYGAVASLYCKRRACPSLRSAARSRDWPIARSERAAGAFEHPAPEPYRSSAQDRARSPLSAVGRQQHQT